MFALLGDFMRNIEGSHPLRAGPTPARSAARGAPSVSMFERVDPLWQNLIPTRNTGVPTSSSANVSIDDAYFSDNNSSDDLYVEATDEEELNTSIEDDSGVDSECVCDDDEACGCAMCVSRHKDDSDAHSD
jgi:hypothetical protein